MLAYQAGRGGIVSVTDKRAVRLLVATIVESKRRARTCEQHMLVFALLHRAKSLIIRYIFIVEFVLGYISTRYVEHDIRPYFFYNRQLTRRLRICRVTSRDLKVTYPRVCLTISSNLCREQSHAFLF